LVFWSFGLFAFLSFCLFFHCLLGCSLMSKCVPKNFRWSEIKSGSLSEWVSEWQGHLLSCQVTAKKIKNANKKLSFHKAKTQTQK
jgi:hypothetical protein